MTRKELFYVEDAIEHEKCMIAYLESMQNEIEEDDLIEFVNKELKTHQKEKQNLLKLLEEEAYE